VTGATEATTRHVVSRDGTRIAVFSSGEGRPLVLVHGTTADHTTFRALAPVLATSFRVHEIDRRGRGASSDGSGPYRIELEYEDVAAVADAVAAESGEPVDVFGHSYGGRCGLGAGLLTAGIARIVVYEGAPAPAGAEGGGYRPAGVEARIAALMDAGEGDSALQAFFREIVRMPESELDAYRANPVWPARVAAVGTALRELDGEASPAASLEALGRVEQPVLQVLGGGSVPIFLDATEALDARLANGRVIVIDGARHAAHHTHVDALAGAIRAFLTDPGVAD
jgi:pimeloyl-ACP methyl ester carboxylesterase